MRIPKTTTRVEENTEERINARIARDMHVRVALYRSAPAAEVQRRVEELDREWDIERTLEANAAGVTILALVLGKTVNRRWYALPAVVAGFLMQHAVQGWCPPLPVFRRLGIRTSREINEERDALRQMLRERGRPARPQHRGNSTGRR